MRDLLRAAFLLLAGPSIERLGLRLVPEDVAERDYQRRAQLLAELHATREDLAEALNERDRWQKNGDILADALNEHARQKQKEGRRCPSCASWGIG